MSILFFRVYLDYNATTYLEADVLQEIHRALETAWGNPSSSYKAGKDAKEIINTARSHVAEMVGGQSDDIIFTSGGTEANNMVFHTVLKYFKDVFPSVDNGTVQSRPHIITSNMEHDSVKLPLEHFVKEGIIDVTYISASKLTGMVNVDDVIAAIRPTTCLITIMMANNETGIIQPISEISKRVKSITRNEKDEVKQILLHTDAAQAIGKIPVDVQELEVDYLTIVGHKFYGPRIGALYVRGPGKDTPLHPMFFGGGQERNFRPGTENTGMIAGLGKAAELVVKHLPSYQNHMREIRDYLESRLQDVFDDRIHFNGRFTGSHRIPNTCNVSIKGPKLKGYKILECVKHLEASVGAACHSENRCQPSHILLSIGIPWDIASTALRLSTGRHTTKEDIDIVIEDLKQAVSLLEESM
ncbi:selenocysteine lyase-like isoform X2 [Antedon mediterranea]|uniref:selenocysteine lyase-like isoform X2 n=1 Tax=Antedon mediterranea TaxID=105859 RepID=UPI003AF59A70